MDKTRELLQKIVEISAELFEADEEDEDNSQIYWSWGQEALALIEELEDR